MLSREESEIVLQQFVDFVARESKVRAPKATKKLANSIKAQPVKVTANAMEATILGEDYLPFIDKGVSGTRKKYNTPFSYKSKGGKTGLKGMPPPSAFDRWNIIRGRASRDESGRFLTRKQLNFATAVSVFRYGIKPTNFFTTPFEQAFAALPDELIEAYGLDVENFMELTLKE